MRKPAMKKPTEDEMRNFYEYLQSIGLEIVEIKQPANTKIEKIEMNGNLVLLQLSITAFKKISTTTRVFKRVT